MLATGYTLTEATPLPYQEAVERVRTELKTEGFGVLCEIDVQATMREKLGVEGEPYLILGACNPPLAHQALQAGPTSACCSPATSWSTDAAARPTSRPSTRNGCSRSSTTASSLPSPRR
jgi:Domain of unknown function DUF302